jgi:hypothetical protein
MALLLLSFLFFKDALFTGKDEMLSGADLFAQHYPFSDFAFQAYRNGQLPLWNPYVYLGFPQFAEPLESTFYPPMWVAAALPLQVPFAALYAFHFALAGIGCYVLVRRLGAGRAGAFIAALVLSYNHFMVTHIVAGHLSPVMTLSYLPWCLVGVHWALHSTSWKVIPLAAVPLGLAFLAGGISLLPVILLATGLLALWLVVTVWRQVGRRAGIRLLVRATAMFGFAALLAGIQLLPSFEFWQRSWRADSSYLFASTGALGFQNLLTLLMPTLLYNDNLSAAAWNNPGTFLLWEHAIYVGIVPVFFIILSWFSGKAQWRFWMFLGMVGIVLSLGPAGAFHRVIYEVLPFLSGFRIPARYSYLLALAAAVLTGLMFDHWLALPMEEQQRLTRPGRKIWLYGLAVLTAITILVATTQVTAQTTPVTPNTSVTNDLMRLLVIGALAGAWLLVLDNHRLPRWQWIGLALAIMLFDLWGNGWRFVTLESTKPQASWVTADAELPPNRNDYRVLIDEKYRLLDANHGYFQKFLNVSGYDGFELATSHNMFQLSTKDARLARLVSARYLLYTVEQNPQPATGWTRLKSLPGLNIDERQDFQARGFVVRDLVAVSTVNDAFREIQRPEIDLNRTAIVEAAARPDCSTEKQPVKPDLIQLQEYTPQKVTLTTATDTTGWLVFNDTYYPGWRAAIDGQPVTIYPTDYALRGLCLPAGEHTVTFEFRPDILKYGAIISGVAWLVTLIAAIAWIIDRRKAQPNAVDAVHLL